MNPKNDGLNLSIVPAYFENFFEKLKGKEEYLMLARENLKVPFLAERFLKWQEANLSRVSLRQISPKINASTFYDDALEDFVGTYIYQHGVPPIGRCFETAARAATDSWIYYVEGYVVLNEEFPINHAWNCFKGEQHFDMGVDFNRTKGDDEGTFSTDYVQVICLSSEKVARLYRRGNKSLMYGYYDEYMRK